MKLASDTTTLILQRGHADQMGMHKCVSHLFISHRCSTPDMVAINEPHSWGRRMLMDSQYGLIHLDSCK